MTSIKKASFPFRIDDNYAFHKIDFAYNFSTIQKIINLDTYHFLAVDQQFNLHFIQYRDQYHHEKTIVPPSFALKGTGRIKFSLEHHTLKAFLLGISVENFNFHQYFMDRRESKSIDEAPLTWPDVFYLGNDRLLIKLSSEEAAVIMYYDHRLELEKLIRIDWLSDNSNLVPVDSSRVIFDNRGDDIPFLTCAVSQKAKPLKFSQSGGIIQMKVITKHGVSIAVAISEDIIQIFDITKNKVIDKIVLFGSTSAAVTVDEVEHSGSFIVYDMKDTNGESKDHIVILTADTKAGIYQIDEKGLKKVHQSTFNHDADYVSEIKPPKADVTYHYTCLKVLDETTFLAVRARENDVSPDNQQLVLFNYSFVESDWDSDAEETEFPGPRLFQYLTSKILMDHCPDKVIGITHWEDKFVVFLTRSKKLYLHDLHTRKFELILTLKGIEANETSFVGLEALKRDYVAALSRRQGGLDQFIIIDIKEKICFRNSHEYYYGRINEEKQTNYFLEEKKWLNLIKILCPFTSCF